MSRMRHALLAAVLCLAAGAASAHAYKVGALTIGHPVMRASIGASPNSAGYMTIKNAGTTPDRLTGATCTCARKVELHTMSMAGGRMTMRPSGPVTVPAGGEVAFRPGGLHLMILGLKSPVADGGRQEMTLTFEKAGSVKAVFNAVVNVDAELKTGTSPGAHAH